MFGLIPFTWHGGGFAGFVAPVGAAGFTLPRPSPHVSAAALVLKICVLTAQGILAELSEMVPTAIFPGLGNVEPLAVTSVKPVGMACSAAPVFPSEARFWMLVSEL